MKQLLTYLYRRTPPSFSRRIPDIWLLRTLLTFLMNRVCEKGTSVAFVPGAFQVRKGNTALRIKPVNWIYGLTLSKDFDNYYDCVVPRQEGGLSVVDYSRDGVQKFRMSGLEFEVSGFPEEEKVIVDYFRWHKPQEGEMVFDLGANCGLSVYYLSQCVGDSGKVYAFEPDPINYGVLQRNIARHKLTNVIPLQKAISAQSGQLKFYSEGTIGSVLAHQSSRPTIGTVEVVEALTLADACAQYGVPSFIKMDIEGAEIEAIGGSQDFLRTHAIQFALDTQHYKNGELTAATVEKLFRECGYEVMSSNETGAMTTWARKLDAKAAA
jgi:FkbM family methyltransferase